MLCSTCLILLSPLAVATSADLVTTLKTDAYFLMSPGSKTFFRRLQKSPWPFLDVSESSAEELMHRLAVKIPDGFQVEWSVYRTRRRPTVLNFVGSGNHFMHEGTRPVIVATIRSANARIVGFFAITFLNTQDQVREAHIDYIVAPNGNGLARDVLMFIRQDFSAVFHLRTLYAELEWAGREYWARPEFGFRLSPLQPSVMYDGRKVSYEVLLLFNFGAFMRAHNVIDRDLCLHLTDGSVIPFDVHYTNSPSLIRCVRRRDGQRVAVNVLKSSENIQPRRLHFGHAFMVSDHQPRKDQLIRVRMGGIDYSDAAMPPWFGVTQPCEEFLE